MRRSSKRSPSGLFSPACYQCGYDIRGIDVARCPECGAEFSLESFCKHRARHAGPKLVIAVIVLIPMLILICIPLMWVLAALLQGLVGS